jgi:hypothetical protein
LPGELAAGIPAIDAYCIPAIRQNPDLPSQHAEEDLNSTRVIEPFDDRKLLRKRSGSQANRFTHAQPLIEPGHSAAIHRCDHRLDDPAGNRARPVSLHHHPRNSKSTVHAAPLVARQIQHDEQIPRKVRANDGRQPARMADRALPFGKKRPKFLVLELDPGALFRKRLGVNHEPPFGPAHIVRKVRRNIQVVPLYP